METINRWQPGPPPELASSFAGRRPRIAAAVWVVVAIVIVGWVLFVPVHPEGGGPACSTNVTFSADEDGQASAISRAESCSLAEQQRRWAGLWLLAASGVAALVAGRARRWRLRGDVEPAPPDTEELRAPAGFRERAMAGPIEPAVDGTPPPAPAADPKPAAKAGAKRAPRR